MIPSAHPIRKQLEDFARIPGLPKSVYSTIADCLSWTRRFYKHETAHLRLRSLVEHKLLPLVEPIPVLDPELAVVVKQVKDLLESIDKNPPPADWYGVVS